MEMLGEQGEGRLVGCSRKVYVRSVSWTDRSPSKPYPRPQTNGKARPCLPPLQPLSIVRRNVEEWPRAGSDDLGVWPCPQTPRCSVKPPENDISEQRPREFEFKRDKLAFFDKECSRIAGHIYLGSDAVAKNRDILKRNGITHVLNCVGFVCDEYFKGDLVYKTLWLQDSPSEDITSILYDVFDYFEDVREQGGRVFVHCCQGVSRSNSLVIAYLMWREGKSFEDAFQYVKAARGVTNPNMGFACQLLQCQKRVHAVPASPNSMLRVYRMAPHSPYAPLHLVPKMLSCPGEQGLDSRGAFIVLVPSATYVWTGKNCKSTMSNNACAAALQVIKYERARGPFSSIKEGEEPPEFWNALSTGQVMGDSSHKNETLSSETNKVTASIHARVGERKVDEYDLDFEIFHKALVGGIVPLFSVSNTEAEMCLPTRENGWDRLRRKFASGIMKEFITSSKLNCDLTRSNDGSEPLLSPASSGSMNYFPTFSPSTSNFSSSFTFSPASSNWSDLSPQHPSPTDVLFVKNSPLAYNSLCNKETSLSLTESFPANRALGAANTSYLCKGITPSIAERRGSNPPPLMLLPSVDESSQVPRSLIRPQSFSLPDLDNDVTMKDIDCHYGEARMLDVDISHG